MGYTLQIDAGEADDQLPDLATNLGWGDVRRWIASLPEATSQELRHFCAYGWSQEVPAIRDELRAALADRAPAAPATRTTAERFLSLLDRAGRQKARVVTLTQGI